MTVRPLTREDLTALLATAKELLGCIASDNGQHGGLLSRQTGRKSDELRLQVSRIERQLEITP